MNKEQKTIAAIQKAVPDIMKIERGCEIKTLKSHLEIEVGTKGIIIDKRCLGYSDVLYYNSARTILYNCDNEDLEIIGRPITLEDVFKALRGRNKDKCVLIAINEEGEFMEWLSGWEEIDIFYDFDKPFTKQPQKTKDFIGDLILNK